MQRASDDFSADLIAFGDESSSKRALDPNVYLLPPRSFNGATESCREEPRLHCKYEASRNHTGETNLSDATTA